MLACQRADWQTVPLTDKSAWAVAALPAGTSTRALRMTFTKGGAGAADDLLADVEEKKGAPSLDALSRSQPALRSVASSMHQPSFGERHQGHGLLSVFAPIPLPFHQSLMRIRLSLSISSLLSIRAYLSITRLGRLLISILSSATFLRAGSSSGSNC